MSAALDKADAILYNICIMPSTEECFGGCFYVYTFERDFYGNYRE